MSHTDDVSQSWLDSAFVEKILKSSDQDKSIQVRSYDVTRATAAGENYASIIYRVCVQYTRKAQPQSMSFIVKTEPPGEQIRKLLAKAKLFEREAVTISEVVPRIHNVLQETLPDPDKIQPFAARCFYTQCGSPMSLIVLEDLKASGFKLVERTERLDMNHSSLVLRTLARYHAASAVLYKHDPGYFQMLEENAHALTKDSMERVFSQGLINLAEEIKKWPEVDDQYAIKLQNISKIAINHLIKMYDKQDGDFNVLIHGDLCFTNMMFRYSDTTGEVQDVRFVDYQLGSITSAAIDLLYFLNTSTVLDLINKQDVLVEEYHKTLGDTLALLDHKHLHPSIEKLKKDLDKKSLIAVMMVCCGLPFILVDRTEVPDINKVMNNEGGVRFSKQYREVIAKILPVYEQRGWLDLEESVLLN